MFALLFGAQGRRSSRTAGLVAALALVAVFAGCGVSIGTAPGATGTQTTGALVRPCDGPSGAVSDVGTVNLVLTTTSPRATGTPGAGGFQPIGGSARVGDVIQIQLPATNRWNLSTVTGGVTLLSPSAVLDQSQGVCFWNFKVTTAGDTTINFNGGALCEVGKLCPLYALLESFLIHVS